MPNNRLAPRVLRGSLQHLFGQLSVLAISLFTTPIIVHGLGTDGYALYTFMWTLCGYLLLLNFGTSTTIQRYVGYYSGRGEAANLSSLLRRLLVFQLAASGIGAFLLWLFQRQIIDLFLHTHGPVLEAAPGVVTCVALAVPSYVALQFGLNTLYGFQRFLAYNVMLALQSVVISLSAVGLLIFGKGLDTIAAMFLAANVSLAAIALLLVLPSLLIRGGRLSDSDLREVSFFSIKNFLNLVLWTVTFQGDRLVIGSLLPLSQLGYYVVPASLMQKMNMLSGPVSATTFPMFAELHGRNEEDRLRNLYLKTSELSLFLVLPATLIAFILAPQFLSLWLGADFSFWGTWPLRFLVLANQVYLMSFLANNIAVTKGHPEIYTYFHSAKVVLLVALWFILIPSHGIAGAAAGTLIGELICSPWLMTRIHSKYLGIDWMSFLRDACYRPAIAGICLLALGLSVHARAGTWPKLFLSGAVGGTLYLAVGYWLLDAEAKALLSDWVRRKI